MIRFEVTIQTTLGKRTFMFRQVFNLDGYKYQVSVFAEVANAYFLMLDNGEGWKFFKPHLLQNWIREVEGELTLALELNHKF